MGEKEGSEVTETGFSLHQFQGVTNGIRFQIVRKDTTVLLRHALS